MSETEDDQPVAEAGESGEPVDDIPSIVPDPDAPLKGITVPDNWLDQKWTTPSGRPGGWA